MRRTPTPDELAAWREYIEAAERIRRVLGARMQQRAGISLADYSVLLALSEAEQRRQRSSVLAEAIGWERSRLSHHLGRMERRGLIERQGNDLDGRGADVAITTEGLQVFRRSSASHFTLIRSLFVEALTPEQLAQAGAVSAAIRRHLDGDGV